MMMKTIHLTINSLKMKKIKQLLIEANGDPIAIFLIIWGAFLAGLTVFCSVYLIYAAVTGQINFSNVQIF